jgi:hypothetical protein
MVTDRAPERLFAAVVALAAGSAVALFAGSRRTAAEDARSAEFGHAVAGLCGGTATSLAPCPGAFDRSLGGCELDLDPLPGARDFCPHHAGPSLAR